MNKIICEMCGGNDIIKQSGLFVCQSCGTNYSPEEAKKLIIEGTVKVDNSDRVEKWLLLGRRSRESGDYVNAEKYYSSVLEENPDNWEAFFFNLLSRAMQCTIAEIGSAADLITNNLNTVFTLIKKQYGNHTNNTLDVLTSIYNLATMLLNAANSNYRQFQNVQGAETEFVSRLISIVNLQYTTGNLLEYHFPKNGDLLSHAVNNWKGGNVLASKWPQIGRQTLEPYTSKIKKYDPSYNPPSLKGVCYIATSVYGSYECPKVWTLRRYRDQVMANTLFGKVFIKVYYLISPVLVRSFGQTIWFKLIFCNLIDKAVIRLQAKGFESTPYVDK